MKIKPAQILGGIAALAYTFSNFLYVVNWIAEGYGMPYWGLTFFTWPISFVVEVAALSIFTVMFKNNLVRYISVGIFLLARLIYSLYWMNLTESGVIYFVKAFVGWSNGVSAPTFILLGQILQVLSLVIFAIALILSFLNLSQTATPTPGYYGNRTVPTVTHTPPVQVKKAQGAYGDIEVLGDLLKKGLLTQKEFDLKKREILGLDK